MNISARKNRVNFICCTVVQFVVQFLVSCSVEDSVEGPVIKKKNETAFSLVVKMNFENICIKYGPINEKSLIL